MPIFEEIAEDIRAANAADAAGRLGEDNKYWQDLGFAFQLHGDPRGAGRPLLFPLVINPKSYNKRLPFASERTPVQDGGVVVESHGVVLGDITLAGNFGLGPRAVSGVITPLSGQAHFFRLQDLCIVRYGELKADPTLSENVYLTFHVLGDNEHFIVDVSTFDLDKKRTTHDYMIQLAILGDAEKILLKAVEDNPVLKEISDAHAQIVKAGATINAGLTDIAARSSGRSKCRRRWETRPSRACATSTRLSARCNAWRTRRTSLFAAPSGPSRCRTSRCSESSTRSTP
jgi:hypothetical protein